jgi:hypothetical protein
MFVHLSAINLFSKTIYLRNNFLFCFLFLLISTNLFAQTKAIKPVAKKAHQYTAKFDCEKNRIIVINSKGQLVDTLVTKLDISILSNPLITVTNCYNCSFLGSIQESIKSAEAGSIIYCENIYTTDLNGKTIKLSPITLIKGKDI